MLDGEESKLVPHWATEINWGAVLGALNLLFLSVTGFILKKGGNWGNRRQDRQDVEGQLKIIIEEYREARAWAEKKAGGEEKKRKEAEAEYTKVIGDLRNEIAELQKNQKIVEGEMIVLSKRVELATMSHTALQAEHEKALIHLVEKDQIILNLKNSIEDMQSNWQADRLRMNEMQKRLDSKA